MKIPHLLASFAVAVTAVAAELKDPAAVADEWGRKIGEASAPPLPQNPIGLAATPAVPPSSQPPATAPVLRDRSQSQIQVPSWGTPSRKPPKQSEPLVDAPSYRVPDVLPDKMPPGSREWKYGGQSYWLIPLIPSREK